MSIMETMNIHYTIVINRRNEKQSTDEAETSENFKKERGLGIELSSRAVV
jgi:MinD superfamily P-loop ATPase